MEEKKVTKIHLSTVCFMLSLIVIIAMGIFIYKLNNEKAIEIKKSANLQTQVNSLNETVSNLQGKLNSISETINSNSTDTNTTSKKVDTTSGKTSFSELMDLLYIKNKTKSNDGNSIFNNYLFDSNNNYDSFGSSKISTISILNTSITLTDKNGNNTEHTVSGINEEIVSVKIDSGDDGVRGIVFLTRLGNVYYLTNQSINSSEFVAKKFPKLSQVIKIDKVTSTAEGAPGSAECIIAIKYDGSCTALSAEYLK